MQSLQNQFVKAVSSYGVHIIAPYVKIIACIIQYIHSLLHLQSYLCLQMPNETSDYCCQNFFENQSLTSHHAAAWYNGNRYYAGVN